jgi:protein gp37
MGKTSIEWTNKTWSPIRARVKAVAGAIARAKGYTGLVNIAETDDGGPCP